MKMNAIYEPQTSTKPISRRIAISDDDPFQRDLLVKILRRDGHDVQDFSTGVALVKSIEEGYRPDLVVTDYQMPDMCGFEVAERLSKVVPGIDVYMVTGQPDQTKLDDAYGKGILRGHLVKPYRSVEISDMISSN